jgi:hypothetical protein
MSEERVLRDPTRPCGHPGAGTDIDGWFRCRLYECPGGAEVRLVREWVCRVPGVAFPEYGAAFLSICSPTHRDLYPNDDSHDGCGWGLREVTDE